MSPSPQRTSNASSWWERSIVMRSTHSIQNMVDTMMEDAHFLQRHEEETANTDKPSLELHRSNVQAGHLLGKGSFSVVCEVQGFIEDREPEHDCIFRTSSSRLSSLDRQDLQDLEGRYVIKHLRPDLVPKPELFQAAAADLLLEAKYLAALDHPGILKLRAVAQGGVQAYMTTGGRYDGFFLIIDRLHCTLRDKILEWQVMQQEESLLEFVEDANQDYRLPLSERLLAEKVDIARQIASALQYMHERRLIFRDLKPANVGLTANNRVQLFDFGFCRELPSWGGDYPEAPEGQENEDDALYYMSGKGSMMYLAPEVLQNGRYNRKADCYSFAMVFYELLTLNRPFHSVPNLQAFRDLLVQHKARPPLEYSDVPLSLQDLLRHAWDNTVRERWTMKQISQRLQEIANELDLFEAPEMEEVAEQPLVSNPSVCGGGVLFGLLAEFVNDIRLGYKVLSGEGKALELEDQPFSADPSNRDFRSYPIEMSEVGTPVCENQCRDPSDQAGIVCIKTAETAESSILTCETEESTRASIAYHSLRVTAMTATEEPLEVTLEETKSPSEWSPAGSVSVSCQELEEEPREAEPSTSSCYSFDDEARHTHDEDELRCPPSPALARTTSAPLQQQSGKINVVNVPLSPHIPQRRQSMGSIKGFYLSEEPDLSPHYPPRRQSTGGTAFAFPESHWLPSAAELHGY